MNRKHLHKSTENKKPLDWHDRPSEIKKSIVNSWKRLNSRSVGQWILNGDEERPYGLCHIDEYQLKIASDFLGYAYNTRSYLTLMAMVNDFIDLNKDLEKVYDKTYSIFTKSGLLKSSNNIQNILAEDSKNHYKFRIS